MYAIIYRIKKQEFEATDFMKHRGNELKFLEAFGGFMVDDEPDQILSEPNFPAKYTWRIHDLLQRLKVTFASFASLVAKYRKPYQNVMQNETYATPYNPEAIASERL